MRILKVEYLLLLQGYRFSSIAIDFFWDVVLLLLSHHTIEQNTEKVYPQLPWSHNTHTLFLSGNNRDLRHLLSPRKYLTTVLRHPLGRGGGTPKPPVVKERFLCNVAPVSTFLPFLPRSPVRAWGAAMLGGRDRRLLDLSGNPVSPCCGTLRSSMYISLPLYPL